MFDLEHPGGGSIRDRCRALATGRDVVTAARRDRGNALAQSEGRCTCRHVERKRSVDKRDAIEFGVFGEPVDFRNELLVLCVQHAAFRS